MKPESNQEGIWRAKLVGAQFGELENVYKITQETLARGSSFDRQTPFN